MEGKNELFQKLKPPCVSLGQAALALNGSRGNVKIVAAHLDTLKRTLSSASPNALNSKLADYVFFPISQVLKVSQKVSIRCLELSLQCMAILIEQGWREQIPSPLAVQITILCTLLGQKKPKGLAFSDTTDELQASAFRCLYHVFSIVDGNVEMRRLLVSESNFPQLGQTISVILDGIHDGGSADAEIAATSALKGLLINALDEEVQATFLPGIVSKLAKVLVPQTKLRRNHKVLLGCLEILTNLLSNTLNDRRFAEIQSNARNSVVEPAKESIIDAKWKEAAAAQLKPVLSNIMRLRSSGRADVQDALADLCATLLRSCRKSLPNCSLMALETMVTLSVEDSRSASVIELQMLADSDTSLPGLLQSILYDSLQSLTTTMQGSDEQAKTLKLRHISTTYALLSDTGVEMSTIERMLATTLRDCVVLSLAVPREHEPTASHASPVQSLDLTVLSDQKGSTDFAPPLTKYRGPEESMCAIEAFAEVISTTTASFKFVGDLTRTLRRSTGEARVANIWLSLVATRAALQRRDTVDNFLDLDDDRDSTCTGHLEELYDFSLAILSDSSDDLQDPRLQALALQGLALRAQEAGEDFRHELVDALYPVLHTLATPDEQLQRDSITTLNIFVASCRYGSVKDLIVENVDYLTNAVALKLNAFDVSPQAPQVLLMMVRLAGAGLLPYLEDTVESIFAALEDYHGYPILVELLFRVLGVVAEEGVKAPQLAITAEDGNGDDDLHTERWQPTSTVGLANLLQHRATELSEFGAKQNIEREQHPHKPWKSIDEVDEDEANEAQSDEHQDQQVDDADLPPPAPKTYNLLFKITELTQHFLPSASPSLRMSLFGLIRTTLPAIAQHRNSFLPLVNTLWPEIVSRLDDTEPQIVATTLDIVAALCEHAGDFMRGRVTQLWPRLLDIYHGTVTEILPSSTHSGAVVGSRQQEPALIPSSLDVKKAVARMQEVPTTYVDTSSLLLWQALTRLLGTCVRRARLQPELVDEALNMLAPCLAQADIRSAFEEENADALWLAEVKTNAIAKPYMPHMLDNPRWQLAAVPS